MDAKGKIKKPAQIEQVFLLKLIAKTDYFTIS